MRRVAAAIVLLTLTCIGGAVPAQSQNLTDELVRKAEAGELESGFCATTNWPAGPNLEEYTAFLKSASAGMSKVNLFADGTCELNRVTRTHTENGGKCVTYNLWNCAKGNSCGYGTTVDCLNNAGVFATRRKL